MFENKYTFIIPENLANYRLDKALAELSILSRSKLKEYIEQGTVIVNNIAIKDAAFKVKAGQNIEIEVPPLEPIDMQPLALELDIFFEDEHLIVLNKPAGLTVHPGAGNYNDTLANALIYHFGQDLSDIGGTERPGIVHRLDKDTSGLMIVAKNNITHAALSEQIADRDVKRVYKTLVWGLPSPLEGKISTNIGRSRSDRTKMTVLQSGGKDATTFYKVEQVLDSGQLSLVECRLQTGRTHQIRVHMSHIGHSVVGDPVYGHNQRKILKYFTGEQKEALENFKRQALHSAYIAFTHPITDKFLEFSCDLPEDMQNLVDMLKG
ncbi:MAG: Ribosomal large subunit pseudouridine synthase RluD subfamily protein [Rickettsiaceae bacterium]|jgi:23S rRNA pseudouridine1911/1915/1917 synthase|nr:Ribosomal large subunit pseudouridine synthase RluD subfamily protein [Rickettsiaceae bacterium]